MAFEFRTDERSAAFCERVTKAMRLLFDIDEAEGRDLLNATWRGFDFIGDDLRYHELELYWAERIGNPNPYCKGIEQERWQTRQDEAERRLEEFRSARLHGWLWKHLASWDERLGLSD
jgi:hypothetical protein